MATYFNLLPKDIIQREIITFLDYHSRTAFNITLDCDEKHIYPLNKDKIAQIEMMLATGPISKALTNARDKVGWQRRRSILRLLSVVLPRNMILCRYNSGFRAAVELKIDTYSDPTHSDYNGTCQQFKNKMIKAVSRLRVLLDTKYGYLHELRSLTLDKWSPVDNNESNLIVSQIGPTTWVSQYGKTKCTHSGKAPEEPKGRRTYRYRYRRRGRSSDYTYDSDYSYESELSDWTY